MLLAVFLSKILLEDRWFLAKFPFYVPAVLALPAALVAGLAGAGPWWWRAGLVAAAGGLGGTCLYIDQPMLFSSSMPSTKRGELRVMTYNVMAYMISEKEIEKAIREADPDVLCVVEGTFGQAPPGLVRLLGKEYRWAVGKRLSIATRLPLGDSGMILDERNVKALAAQVRVNGEDVTVVAVDVRPPVRRDDWAAFDELYAVIQMQLSEGRPFVLSGDLNVPRGSYHLRRATAGLTDAFQAAPAGRHVATWPSWLPLWQIDHAFNSPGVVPARAEVLEVFGSDHLPIVVEYEMVGSR